MDKDFAAQLTQIYPKSLPFSQFMRRISEILREFGFNKEKTLFANCTCRDEINYEVINLASKLYGENFHLAGLGGYPSSGATGFGAMASHVPDNGNLFILYGPHVGYGRDWELGTIRRKGMRNKSSACGSLLAYVDKLKANNEYQATFDDLDAEQYLVENNLSAYSTQILQAQSVTHEVTEKMFSVIHDSIHDIIGQLKLPFPVAAIGGVLVNTPVNELDYWCPRNLNIINPGGTMTPLTESFYENLKPLVV